MIQNKLLFQLSYLAITSSICVLGQPAKTIIKDPEAIKKAIMTGQLSTEFAERASKSQRFTAQPILANNAPAGIWLIEDDGGHYTIFIESNHLVLLCSDKQGGQAHDFEIEWLDDEKILHFTYETGSDRKAVKGKYVFGSWKFISKQFNSAP